MVLALVVGACVPSLGANDALVTAPRILAVRAEPAEAKPGARVTFTALVAGPEGPAAAPPIAWSFCEAPKPLTEDNVVSDACLGATSQVPAGAGTDVAATTPSNGCSLFGPVALPGGVRPRDPDDTGGYYQPLRADLPGSSPTFALARITCDLANASAASATAFASAYVPNHNPTLLPLAASIQGASARLTAIPAGVQVDLKASWPAASAETYAYYDAASDTVTSKREAMSVAWYTSAGALDSESTGRAGTDPNTTSDNRWTPSSVGTTFAWIVLRDSRGGVDFAVYQVTVVP